MGRAPRLVVKVELVLALLLVVAFIAAVLLELIPEAIGDLRGTTVDAQIVSIMTNSPGRRVYHIRLVTLSGHTCVTEVDSGSNPPPREIRVGGTSRVHYSARNTCADDSVRESTSSPPGDFIVPALLGIVGGLGVVWDRRRRLTRAAATGRVP